MDRSQLNQEARVMEVCRASASASAGGRVSIATGQYNAELTVGPRMET